MKEALNVDKMFFVIDKDQLSPDVLIAIIKEMLSRVNS
jgi:hypothetical protein